MSTATSQPSSPSGAPPVWDAFVAATGREPDVVASAPGRVNLIGEHLDYNDGPVLPFAIEARTWVAVGRRPAGADPPGNVLVLRSRQRAEVSRHDVAELLPGRVGGWASYVAGVLWALGPERTMFGGGLDVVVDGTVPVGAGLSSSAALECATALAVNDLHGLGLGETDLAHVARRAENDFVGVPCGVMDQMAAMRCIAGHALLLDTEDGSTDQVPLELDAAGAVLLVVDTRVHHALGDGAYADRTQACAKAAAALGVSSLRHAALDTVEQVPDETLQRRARHVVTETARVGAAVAALRAGELTELGRLMTASHTSLRDDYEVSCAELDTAVTAALDAGALGARMTGAGFGGSAVALVPNDRVRSVRETVAAAALRAGHPEPAMFTTRACAGASRWLG